MGHIYDKVREGIKMIIIMNYCALKDQIQSVVNRLNKEGFQVHISHGKTRTVIGVIGKNTKEILPKLALEALPGVEKVVTFFYSCTRTSF